MRGGEGNARAIQYSYFSRPEELIVPFFCNSKATLKLRGGSVTLRQETGYPYSGTVTLHVVQSSVKKPISLRLAAPWWTKSHRITVNGRQASAHRESGLVGIRTKLHAGDTVLLAFELVSGWRDTINRHSIRGYRCLHTGPVMLGCKTEAEIALRADCKILPGANGEFRTEPDGVVLERINNLNDLDVAAGDLRRRQVLFRT